MTDVPFDEGAEATMDRLINHMLGEIRPKNADLLLGMLGYHCICRSLDARTPEDRPMVVARMFFLLERKYCMPELEKYLAEIQIANHTNTQKEH